MTKVTKFVSRFGTYTFPDTEQALSDNFKDVVTKSTRLPGVDGGIDEYGTGRAPSAVGNINFSFYLVSSTLEGMQPKLDTLGALRSWGVGALFYQPTDLSLPVRWAFCRISRIDTPKRLDKQPDRFQLVQMSLQASQPYWYAGGTERLWDDGGLFDDGGLWDGNASAPAPTTITNSGTLTVSPSGNVPTTGRVIIKNSSGSPIQNPIVQRIRDAEIVDQIKFWGAIADGDWLEIDPRSHRVMMGISGADQYDNCEFLDKNWLVLYPGSNTIQVYVNGVAGVAVRYMERYV